MKQSLFSIMLMMSINAAMAQRAIDVHSHIITTEYVATLERNHAEMEEGFPVPQWSAESLLNFMNEAGIDGSVLTLSAPQPFFGDADESRRCIRQINETAARLKAAQPEKIRFCAALPLPDVEAAVAEAIYALDTLHADGVKLATNSRGQYLGDESLDPLMAVLNARHAVIIVHPCLPTPFDTALMRNTPLAMSEYPAETTRAVVNLISRNVLARYPNLKIVVPHCGSYLPLALPRMRAIYPAVRAKGLIREVDWEANLSRLYFDLAGNPSPEVLRALLTIAAPDHILYGSDYPYLPANVLAANLEKLKKTLSADEKLAPHADKILRGNALKLFNLKQK